MTVDETSGNTIDKATRFGERFGFPALVTIILLGAIVYGAYFVLRYEVFYTRGKVEAMAEDVVMMSSQHTSILSKQEASLEIQAKQFNVQCATCWNSADNQTEIKRCSCSPNGQ